MLFFNLKLGLDESESKCPLKIGYTELCFMFFFPLILSPSTPFDSSSTATSTIVPSPPYLFPSTGRAKAYDGVGISLALHQASDLDGAAGALVRKS